MTISTLDLAKARESASRILEALQLDAFIYEVEPRDGVWELTVECACEADGGWETVTLEVPGAALLDSLDDANARQQLMDYCKKNLANCKLREA